MDKAQRSCDYLFFRVCQPSQKLVFATCGKGVSHFPSSEYVSMLNKWYKWQKVYWLACTLKIEGMQKKDTLQFCSCKWLQSTICSANKKYRLFLPTTRHTSSMQQSYVSWALSLSLSLSLSLYLYGVCMLFSVCLSHSLVRLGKYTWQWVHCIHPNHHTSQPLRPTAGWLPRFEDRDKENRLTAKMHIVHHGSNASRCRCSYWVQVVIFTETAPQQSEYPRTRTNIQFQWQFGGNVASPPPSRTSPHSKCPSAERAGQSERGKEYSEFTLNKYTLCI